jgi:Fe-Mn family superoxide dismutase
MDDPPARPPCPGEVERALREAFGGVQQFKEPVQRRRRGPVRLGLGVAVKDADGSLKITKTENGVNPPALGQTALLGCDVWEHSYYIDFRNKRPAYLTNWLDNLVNWENVASRM